MSFPAEDGWVPLADGTFIGVLGAVYHRETEDGCELGLAAGPHLKNRSGNVHGGALMVLIDRAGGMAAYKAVQDGRVATASLTVNFLRPIATDAEVIVRSRLRRAGKKSFFTDAEALAGGRLVATGSAVYMRVEE